MVLVIYGKSFGDTVVSGPDTWSLKVQLDDPGIHFLTYRTSVFLMRDNLYITRTRLIDRQ
ncbi:MAG: hypothetical protein ABIS36_17135 [Chryseolinea sp.]